MKLQFSANIFYRNKSMIKIWRRFVIINSGPLLYLAGMTPKWVQNLTALVYIRQHWFSFLVYKIFLYCNFGKWNKNKICVKKNLFSENNVGRSVNQKNNSKLAKQGEVHKYLFAITNKSKIYKVVKYKPVKNETGKKLLHKVQCLRQHKKTKKDV